MSWYVLGEAWGNHPKMSSACHTRREGDGLAVKFPGVDVFPACFGTTPGWISCWNMLHDESTPSSFASCYCKCDAIAMACISLVKSSWWICHDMPGGFDRHPQQDASFQPQGLCHAVPSQRCHVAAPLRQDRIEVTAALEHRLSSENAQMEAEF